MVQILVSQSALQGLYHRQKERTEKAAQAKMTAETTSILLTNHVFDLLKPASGLPPGNWISPRRLTGINCGLVTPVDGQLEVF